MLHEDCNALTVELVSNDDGITLFPQQCDNINVPSLPPITHEDCTEITKKYPREFLICAHASLIKCYLTKN